MIEETKQKKRLLEDNFDITPTGLEFCFDREIFLQDEFDVDHFVVDHKKRVPLETLRDDLLQYFNILKSSLIELINQDYADFVNLSTNLVGLDRAIGTIQSPLEHLRTEVEKVQTEINNTAHEIERRMQTKKAIREKKALIHVVRSMDSCVSRLERWLCVRGGTPRRGDSSVISLETNIILEENLGQMLERIGTEFSKLQFFTKRCQGHPMIEELKPRILSVTAALQSQLETSFKASLDSGDRKAVRQVLRTYLGIDKVAQAERIYRDYVVAPKLRQIINDKYLAVHGLTDLFAASLNFLEKDFQQMKQHINNHSKGFEALSEFDFLVNSFWPECVECLCTNLSSIFAPGDPDLFYKRYTESLSFLDNLESHCESIDQVNRLRRHPAHSDFLNKWSLPVYFQIRFQDIASLVENEMAHGVQAVSGEQNNVQLDRCWEDGVYLDALRHRFWKLTLQILNRYAAFIEDVRTKDVEACEQLKKEQPSHSLAQKGSGSSLSELTANSNSSRRSTPTSFPSNGVDNSPSALTVTSRVRLVLDIGKMEEVCSSLVQRLVVNRLKGSRGVDRAGLNCSIEESLQRIKQGIDPIISHIQLTLKDQCSLHVRLVNDVPRQYRKTNRDWPSKPSAYVSSMLRPLDLFLTEQRPLFELVGERAQPLQQIWVKDTLIELASLYESQMSELLISVKRTEDSLKKLRRARGTAATVSSVVTGDQSTAATDDDKIRQQLLLDANHFREQILTLFKLDSNDIPKLDDIVQLTESAKVTAASSTQETS